MPRKRELDALEEEVEELLKKEIVSGDFTPEEWKRYRERPDLFAEEVCGAILYDGDDYEPLPNHRKFLQALTDNNAKYWIVAGARASGKTFLIAIMAMWMALFLPKEFGGRYEVAILAGCLPPDQLILKNSCLTPISEIKNNDRVITESGSDIVRQTMTRQHTGLVVNIQPYGYPIGVKVTPNHPILVLRNGQEQWIPADLIQYSDKLVWKLPKFEKYSLPSHVDMSFERVCKQCNTSDCSHLLKAKHPLIHVDTEFFRLVGYYLAEGSSNQRSIKFSFGDDDVIAINDCVTILKNKGFNVHIRQKGHDVRVWTSSVFLRHYLKMVCGLNAHDKHLPDQWLGLDNEYLNEIMYAYTLGDGYIRKNRTTLYTVSDKLSAQLFLILTKLGYTPSINRRFKKVNFENRTIESLCWEVDYIPEKHKKGQRMWHKGDKIIVSIHRITRESYFGDVLNLHVDKTNYYTAPYITLHNSGDQAERLYDYIRDHLLSNDKLAYFVETGFPQKTKCVFKTGGRIITYRSSTTSVRSRHPACLIIDEAAEADKNQESAVVRAALNGINAGTIHGRVVMISTLHYLDGVFGNYWEKAEEYGYKRARWDNAPSHRPWIPLDEQTRRWENAKKTDPNFATEWAAQPSIAEEKVFNDSDVDECTKQPFHVPLPPALSEKVEKYWLSFDFGFHPHITVLTLWCKLSTGIAMIMKQEAMPRHSTERVVSKANRYRDQYGVGEIYGDSSGQLFIDTMIDAGYRVIPVKFTERKEALVDKLNVMLTRKEVIINPNCRELIRQIKRFHRDDKGKIVKGDDDYIDSAISGVEFLTRGEWNLINIDSQDELEKFLREEYAEEQRLLGEMIGDPEGKKMLKRQLAELEGHDIL